MDLEFDGLTLFESHRRHRRAVQPGFHPQRIAARTPEVRRATQETIARWRPGETVRVDKAMAQLACSVNAHAVSGDTPALHQVMAALASLSSQTTHGLYWRLSLPQLARLKHVPGTGRFQRALSDLRTAVTAAVAHHRSQGTTGDDVLSPASPLHRHRRSARR